MHELEIRALLTTIKSYDGRNLNDADVLAWMNASTVGRWDSDQAMNAVHTHYSVETSWIMPAHITEFCRQRRIEVTERKAREEAQNGIEGGGQIEDGWPVGDDPWGGKRNSMELEQVHVEAMQFPCEYCQKPAGERCTNRITGNATKIPHVKRLVAARKAQDAASVES